MRVASFNILSGRSISDGVIDLDRLAAAITALDADILALQEVDRDQPRSEHADLTAVAAEAMGAVAWRFVPTLAGTPGMSWTAATGDEPAGTASYGIALLSRYPVRFWEQVRLPHFPFRAPVPLPGSGCIAILREEPRVALLAAIDSPLGSLTVANTHLAFVPGLNVLQLHRLRRHLEALPGPVLLAGDLNVTSSHARRITGFRTLGDLPTYPADRPTRQLDHLLANAKFEHRASCRTLELPVSDHRALIADLA